MGRLIMWNLVSVDGYYDGTTAWDLAWFQSALDDAFHRFVLDQLRTAELLVFGRLTYEGMARHWRSATGDIAAGMNATPKLVVSRTLGAADWENTRVNDDPVAALPELKRQVAGNMFVFGSGNLCGTLNKAGLFDEYRLGLTSVVLGNGRRLFEAGAATMNWNLIEARTLSARCLVLRYEPRSAGPG